MRLKQKVIMLAVAPLVVALCAITLYVRQQAAVDAQVLGQIGLAEPEISADFPHDRITVPHKSRLNFVTYNDNSRK